MDQGETWHESRPRTLHCVKWEPSSSPFPKRHSPQFSAHVCCGQTAGWSKMPLGTKVGVGPGDIVLHGDPVSPPPKKGDTSLQFRSMSIVAKRLDDQDATWYGGRPLLGPGDILLDGDPALPSPKRKGGVAPPSFSGRSASLVFSPCLLWPNGRPS